MRGAIWAASLLLGLSWPARADESGLSPAPASGFGQKWISMGATYDQLRAKTLDWADDSQTATAGDGDLELRGVGVYLVGRHRNRTRFEPYGTLGFAWYQSHFDVSPGWAAPGRRFEVEDTDGWFISAGCKMNVAKHVGVDVMFRYSHVGDVAARAYFGRNRYREGAFPMRNEALAIGVLCAF